MRCILLFFTIISVSAQDPYVTLPRNYKVEFDNAYVRVSRVRYNPGDELPAHAHPSLPTVYVYLQECGPARFTHHTPSFTIERSPVTAGGVRFNRNAQHEIHTVTYLGTEACESARIELKTIPGPRHKDARLREAKDFPWEDRQVKISTGEGPLSRVTRRGVLIRLPQKTLTWVEPRQRGGSPALGEEGRWVRIELKTSPLR